MNAEPQDARDFARAVRVTVATSFVLFAAWCVMVLASRHLPLGDVPHLACSIACYSAPIVVIAVHLRVQHPRCSSVGGAIWTGLTSCVLGFVLILTVGLWLDVQLGGELFW